MIKTFALKEEHKIDIRKKLKSDKIAKIFIWSIPENQIAVRKLFGIIQPIRK